jgi:hypothetical protein
MLDGALVVELDHARNRGFAWRGDAAIVEFGCDAPCEKIAQYDLENLTVPWSLDQGVLKRDVRKAILSLIPDLRWFERRHVQVLTGRSRESCDLIEPKLLPVESDQMSYQPVEQ